MKEEKTEEKVARITARGVILGALIGTLGTIITAILAFPPFQTWILSPDTNAALHSSLPIEQITGVTISTDHDPAYVHCEENLSIGNFATRSGSFLPTYFLSFESPFCQGGRVGLVFSFPNSLNISGYTSIQFDISFGVANQAIDLYLMDISNGVSFIRITTNGIDLMHLTYTLDSFSSVNLNAVKQLGFYVDSSMNNSSDVFAVNEIQLVH